MTKIAGILLLLVGAASFAMASATSGVPEIDPASAVAAIALVSGALLIIRGRRKK